VTPLNTRTLLVCMPGKKNAAISREDAKGSEQGRWRKPMRRELRSGSEHEGG